jgi:hypothetical protein
MDKVQYIWKTPNGGKSKITIDTDSDGSWVDKWFKQLEDCGWVLVSSKRKRYSTTYIRDMLHNYWFWAYLFVTVWFDVIKPLFGWNK